MCLDAFCHPDTFKNIIPNVVISFDQLHHSAQIFANNIKFQIYNTSYL